MEFELSEDQRQIKQSIREFAEPEIARELIRQKLKVGLNRSCRVSKCPPCSLAR
jgi:hypothetical protein